MLELQLEGVAEDNVVIEHTGQRQEDDDGAGVGEFFIHKFVLLGIASLDFARLAMTLVTDNWFQSSALSIRPTWDGH